MSFEEDTYTTIFKAMQHPIRRRILRMISENPSTYTEIQKDLNIDNGLLNYHLEALSSLITKNGEDKYTLSDFGKATAGLIKGIEEPVAIRASAPKSRQDLLLKIVSLSLIVILSFSTWSLYSNNQELTSNLNDQEVNLETLQSNLFNQKANIDTLQSYIETLTTRVPAYRIIPNQARYYVGDAINATYSYVNPTNQTITLSSTPTLIHYYGHYSGEENYPETMVQFSRASTDFAGYKILPGHVYDIWTMTFYATKSGFFEIHCNDITVTVQVSPENARILPFRVSPANVTTEDSVQITTFNVWPSTITFGNQYTVEKMLHGSWVKVPVQYISLRVLRDSFPGGSYSETVNVTGLDSGSYRISKEIDLNGGKQLLSAFFSVARPTESESALPHWGLRYVASVAEASTESPDRPMLILDNMGARSLSLNDSYILEHIENGTYTPFYIKEASGNSSLVEWGGYYNLIISEPISLPAGNYRLIKSMGVQGTTVTKTLVIDFDWPG